MFIYKYMEDIKVSKISETIKEYEVKKEKDDFCKRFDGGLKKIGIIREHFDKYIRLGPYEIEQKKINIEEYAIKRFKTKKEEDEYLKRFEKRKQLKRDNIGKKEVQASLLMEPRLYYCICGTPNSSLMLKRGGLIYRNPLNIDGTYISGLEVKEENKSKDQILVIGSCCIEHLSEDKRYFKCSVCNTKLKQATIKLRGMCLDCRKKKDKDDNEKLKKLKEDEENKKREEMIRLQDEINKEIENEKKKQRDEREKIKILEKQIRMDEIKKITGYVNLTKIQELYEMQNYNFTFGEYVGKNVWELFQKRHDDKKIYGYFYVFLSGKRLKMEPKYPELYSYIRKMVSFEKLKKTI